MKSANVLLDNDGNVKLSDFGISMQTNKLKENQNMKGVFGTYGYMSPEAADPKRPMCKGSDIYSLGCIMIEMITGKVPFSDLEADPPCVLRKIAKGTLKPMLDGVRRRVECAEENFAAGTELLLMLQQMLEHDHTLRPTAADLLVCPYVLHSGDRTEERAGSASANSLLVPHWSSHHTKAQLDTRGKLRVVVLHACPLAIANGECIRPLLWRERGIDDMRESMLSSLSSTHIGITLAVYPASSQEFVKSLRSSPSPDVLVISGQDVLTEDYETPSESFGVVVEDENGAAQSLDLESARAQHALEFPKVCVVLGKESRPAAIFLRQCGAPCVICVYSGGGPPITPQNSRYVTCTIVAELIKMSAEDTVCFFSFCVSVLIVFVCLFLLLLLLINVLCCVF
jgi:serine/threonine protein kinase